MLKTALTLAPFFASPDSTETFLLATDASGSLTGAVLTSIQHDDRDENQTITYASRIFSNTESRSSITDL